MRLLRGNIHSEYFKAAKKKQTDLNLKSCVAAKELLDPNSEETISHRPAGPTLSCPNTKRILEQIVVHFSV